MRITLAARSSMVLFRAHAPSTSSSSLSSSIKLMISGIVPVKYLKTLIALHRVGQPLPFSRLQQLVRITAPVSRQLVDIRGTAIPSNAVEITYYAKRVLNSLVVNGIGWLASLIKNSSRRLTSESVSRLSRLLICASFDLRFDLLAFQPFAEFRPSSPAGYIADRNGNRLLLSD
jgi:hypothetical protein